MSIPTTQICRWEFEGHFISTDPSLLPLDKVNEALASDRMPWARALSEDELRVMVDSSVLFGLYTESEDSTPVFVGMARLVTDKVTFAYLTDVWISESSEGHGLGTWMIECVGEWAKRMPSLRQLALITGQGKKENFYAGKLGTMRFEDIGPNVNARCFVKPGPAGSFR